MTTTMGIPAIDYDMDAPDAGCTEKEFRSRANIMEGISGKDRIDTYFETTERTQVLAPRGDQVGRPMPRDARGPGTNNHGEWGPDQYHRVLDVLDTQPIDTDEG